MYFKSHFSKQKSSTGTGSATLTRTGISSSARKGLSLAAASFMAAGLLTSAGASAAHADEAVIPDSATITPAAAAPAGPAPGTLLEATPAPHLLNIVGPQLPGYAQRIRYASQDSNGAPVDVTGYVNEPTTPGKATGQPRPS